MKAKAAQIERISTLEAVDMIDSPIVWLNAHRLTNCVVFKPMALILCAPIRIRIRDGSASRFIKSE